MSVIESLTTASAAAPRAGAERRTGAPSEAARATLLGLVLPFGAALLWEIAVRAGWMDGRLAPPPSVVAASLRDLAVSGDLWLHARATLERVAAGFALGVAAGTSLGVLSGASATARALLDPTLQALRAVPSIAWAPLFILWFGIFEPSKVMLIAVGVALPIYLGTLGAILSVDRKIVEVGRSFRLGGFAMARRILFPSVLPHYVIALRSGLGLGWMFVVAAEIMGASEGVGYLLVDGQQLGKPAQIVAAIIIFAVLGKATDFALAAVSSRWLRWQDTAPQNSGRG